MTEKTDPMMIAQRAAAQQTPDRTPATRPLVNFDSPRSRTRTWTKTTST